MSDFPSAFYPSPELFAEKADWAEETLRQTEKDFRLQGMEIALPAKAPGYNELVKILASILRESDLLHSPKLTGLLYQVDVKEAKIRHILASTPPEHMHEVMADTILKRCFTKVYWRHTLR